MLNSILCVCCAAVTSTKYKRVRFSAADDINWINLFRLSRAELKRKLARRARWARALHLRTFAHIIQLLRIVLQRSTGLVQQQVRKCSSERRDFVGWKGSRRRRRKWRRAGLECTYKCKSACVCCWRWQRPRQCSGLFCLYKIAIVCLAQSRTWWIVCGALLCTLSSAVLVFFIKLPSQVWR